MQFDLLPFQCAWMEFSRPKDIHNSRKSG